MLEGYLANTFLNSIFPLVNISVLKSVLFISSNKNFSCAGFYYFLGKNLCSGYSILFSKNFLFYAKFKYFSSNGILLKTSHLSSDTILVSRSEKQSKNHLHPLTISSKYIIDIMKPFVDNISLCNKYKLREKVIVYKIKILYTINILENQPSKEIFII